MPEIFSISVSGSTAIIVGLDFGFFTGEILVAPTDNKSDSTAVSPTIVTWTDDRIEVSGTGVSHNDAFWFVVDINGFANLSGFFVGGLVTQASVGLWNEPITSAAWWRSSVGSVGWWQQENSVGWWKNSTNSVGWWNVPRTSTGWWKET